MARLVLDYCKHFPTGIDDPNHCCDAKIVLIGEAPGRNEDERGVPFVGAAGFMLDGWLEKAGLNRRDLWITNVVRRRPPNNEIYAIGREALERGIEELHQRLAKLADPYVIIPTGDIALNALLGPNHTGRLRITDWRGSVLQYSDRSGRSVKVIPTIHPAATFRQPILTKFCIADWLRIAGDSQFKELRLPERELIIDPNNGQVERFIAAVVHLCDGTQGCICPVCENALKDGCGPVMAIDVENSMKDGGYFDKLTCAGFSYDPRFAMTISTRRKDYGSEDTYNYALNAVKALCESPIAKVLQNGLTDAIKLHVYGINVHNYAYDLMEMDHALDPNDGGDTEKGSEDAPKDKTFKLEMRSLKILTSLFTREPYYKAEGKLGPDFDWVKHMKYNGKDACTTREICGVLRQRLRNRGLL
ncbi:MAG: hypothetical protein KGJ90_03940 [Patescibacteria group bacterium]|nr:hypothetical protein [Patescibacteria group bacterium]